MRKKVHKMFTFRIVCEQKLQFYVRMDSIFVNNLFLKKLDHNLFDQ